MRRTERPRPERAALATKHGKEALFGPPFAAIGWDTVVAPFDTDRFGTFSGEIDRPGTPRSVVVSKARAGAEAAGLPVGLASEGSFGSHPTVPFAVVDEELVAWVDTTCDHVVIERAAAISTVPPAATVAAPDDVASLRVVSSFPDQAAIVVHEHDEGRHVVAKGITDLLALHLAVEEALGRPDGRVVVEPDLRSHLCPDRRTVIATAVERLAARIDSRCTECGARGPGPIRSRAGLPCALCGLPTTCTAADVIGCTRCGHEYERVRNGAADPTHCDRCNP